MLFCFRSTWLTCKASPIISSFSHVMWWIISANSICYFLLKQKKAKEVTQGLIERVFSVFGLPSVLHSDNGSEFVNEILRRTIILWPGTCKIVNGSPGHSQSQGLVEQGNRTIELMISARETDNGSTEWAKWLPEIQCKYFC